MLKFKKQIIFLFGCIALITYLSVHFSTVEETSVGVISTADEGVHMQVYLKDKDRILVPLSIPVDEETNEEEKLQYLFSYMSGKQKIKGFYPLFTKECKLQKASIQNGVASLYFDESLKNYQKEDELRVLEAITWGATQFHDVEQVKLFMKEQAITQMPLAATPIPEVLNRSIGINHFETAVNDLHTSTSITVFAAKKICGQEYLVPKSRRIALQEDSMTSSVQAILADISASSELIQPLYAQHIQVEGYRMENGLLRVELNKNILNGDKSVKQNIYDTLVLSLATLEGIERVEVKVDGNVITPKKQNEQAVSKYELNYNCVKF